MRAYLSSFNMFVLEGLVRYKADSETVAHQLLGLSFNSKREKKKSARYQQDHLLSEC